MLVAAPVLLLAAADTFLAALNIKGEGQVLLEVNRKWAPLAAQRMHDLVSEGFYNHTKIFRAVDGFMVQFGISGDPRVSAQYGGASFPDEDPADQKEKQSNARGMVSFASAGPNTRSTQVFINTVDNTYLDDMGFAPFARVTYGLPVVDRFVTEYGEDPMAQHMRQRLIRANQGIGVCGQRALACEFFRPRG